MGKLKKIENKHLVKVLRFHKCRFYVLPILTAAAVLSMLSTFIFIFKPKIAVIVLLVSLFLLLADFVAVSIFVRIRYKLIDRFDSNDFDDYINYLANGKYYYTVSDILLSGVWEVLKAEKYQSISESNPYMCDGLTKRDYLMICLIRTVTYSKNGRFYRIPKVVNDAESMVAIYKECVVLFNDRHKEDSISYPEKLIKLERDYFEKRKEAKQKGSSISSDGGLKELFIIASNDDNKSRMIKLLILVGAIIVMFFDGFNILPDFNKKATIVFEMITIFLLFMDVAKDRDKDYLH